jgi:restriction system protein
MDVCPPFNRFFKPLLVFANTGEVNVAEVAALIADDLNLTIQARSETTKSGKRKRYIDRTQWAVTYLRQAGLVRTTKRGFVSITAEGRAFLTAHASDIIVDNLKTIPAFVDFQQRRRGPNLLHSVHDNTAEDLFTPHDRIGQALDEIEDELAMTFLEQLQTATPPFFEKVVVDLLLHMGYGGAQDNAGRVLGQAGDNGIDGVIDQDPLGLERVYL